MSNLEPSVEEMDLLRSGKLAGIEPGAECELDGLTTEHQIYPAQDEAVAHFLALASKSQIPVSVVGGGTKFAYGSPLNKLAWILNTSALVDQPIIKTDDLVVICKAGMPLSTLQAQLKQKGLFLPIDAGNKGATVGGILAQGGGSSHRMEYGLIRDLVLGLTVALTDGKLYTFGGQTVKNVTGYDLRKLFVGSKGTLGVITEVSLRVYAIPPASKVLIASLDSLEQAFKTAGGLRELRPAVLEIYDQSLFRQIFDDIPSSAKYQIVVKYLGPDPLVEKKYRDTLNILARQQSPVIREFSSCEDGDLWAKRADYFEDNRWQPAPTPACRVKISVPANRTFGTAQALDQMFQKYQQQRSSLYLPCLGLINVSFNCPDNLPMIEEMKTVLGATRGFLNLEKGPLALRQSFFNDPWDDWPQRIKNYFDPQNVLNPGKRP